MTKRILSATSICLSVMVALPSLADQSRVCDGDTFSKNSKASWFSEACTKQLRLPGLGLDERAEMHYLRALWRSNMGQNAAAEVDLLQVLKMFPNHARATHQLGNITFDRTRDSKKARRLLLRSIELDPKRSYVFVSLGYLERYVGNNPAAVEAFSRALELKPTHAWARYKRSEVLEYLKDFKDVLRDTAYLSDPTNSLTDQSKVLVYQRYVDIRLAAAVRHGETLRALNQYRKAEAWFDKLVSDYSGAIALVARARFLDGLPVGKSFKPRQSEALRDIDAAITHDPNLAAAYRHKAQMLRSRRTSMALELQTTAIQLREKDQRSPILLWERALMLRKLGRRDEAIADALNAIYMSSRLRSAFGYRMIQRLAQIGYYISPERNFAKGDRAIQDAVTACMHDETCW